MLESAGTKHLVDLKSERNHLAFEARIRKNSQEYLVARTFGKKVTVKDPLSEVSLQVTQGVRAVVMQSINMDFHLLRKVISAEECLAAPVVQFHMDETGTKEIKEVEYKYKITIPHYLSRHHDLSNLRVKCGNLRQPLQMTEVQKGNPQGQLLPCFEIDKKCITVYADHFCPVVCTSTQKVCTSKIIAMPYGWIGTHGDVSQTHMKVKTYLCNYLYNNGNLKQV